MDATDEIPALMESSEGDGPQQQRVISKNIVIYKMLKSGMVKIRQGKGIGMTKVQKRIIILNSIVREEGTILENTM